MDVRRIILYLALALIAIALWNAWTEDHQPKVQPQSGTVTSQTQTTTSSSNFAPAPFTPGTQNATGKTPAQMQTEGIPQQQEQFITIQTDLLDVQINTSGGDVVVAKLRKYPVSLQQKNVPIQILNNNFDNIYVVQSGITNAVTQGPTAPIQYKADQTSYVLAPNQQSLQVNLMGRTSAGLEVTKSYTFTRNQYDIHESITVKNNSNTEWQGSFYHQLVRRYVPVKHGIHSWSYDGGAISSAESPYEKLPFKDLNEKDISRTIESGWIAMQQRYFLSALIPAKGVTYHYYSHASGLATKDGVNRIFSLGFVSPQVTLRSGESATNHVTIYIGPEIAKYLKPLAKGLDLTIDYGWLWIISVAIFWVMEKIYSFVGNWGWSIVLTTILIKLLFYKLSEKSYRSMAKMRDLQPRMQALKERHSDDKQALSRATMELYKKEKVNPMGGCLPMLVQIPVFIALYYVLVESVQLRQAPFILWIHDLSVKDPYFILPILMGISMFVQQKLSPPPPDPTQAKVMLFLPVIFTVFFATFPAGLVLYWLTNNVVSIAQQWWIMKTYKAKEEKKKNKKKNKNKNNKDTKKLSFKKK